MAIATLSIDINARMANIERDMGRAAQIAERNSKRMEEAFSGVGKTLAGLGALLGAGSFGLWIRGAVDAAAQVERLSQLSGAGAVEFQRYAAGSKSVGIETEKLADIFKDVNDKVGEFILTGGGELKDFFETIAPKVGVTAEQFRNLSGPQALQLYFNSLQKANVSQAEMTFFMEAIADEASALAPLLANNGAKFKDLADEAERLGGIYSEQLVKESKAFNDNMGRLQVLSNGIAVSIGNALIPSLNELAEEFLNARIAGLSFMEALAGIGLSDPTKTPAEQIARLTEELDKLQNGKWYEKSLLENLMPEEAIAQKKKELEYFRLQLLRGGGDDPRDRSARGASAPLGGTFRPDPPAAKPKKSAGRTRTDDPLGDFAKDADAQMKPYFDALQKFEQMQADSVASTANLTRAEKEFFDLINSPEWQAMSEPLQEKVRASFEAANATERMTDAEKRLQELLANPVLEARRAGLKLLDEAYAKGRISVEEYEAAVKRLPSEVAPVKDEFEDLKRTIQGWGEDSAQAIVDFALTGKSSFSDMVESMLADMAKMMIYKNVTGPMASAVSSFFAPNADGGVYSSPSLSKYSGGVYDSPRFFAFANGAGVFGEAGPEAIMPLSRDSRGRLGVKAEGGGGANLESIRVEIKNEGTAQEVRSVQPRFDAEGLVVGVVLRDLRSNGPIRQALG